MFRWRVTGCQESHVHQEVEKEDKRRKRDVVCVCERERRIGPFTDLPQRGKIFGDTWNQQKPNLSTPGRVVDSLCFHQLLYVVFWLLLSCMASKNNTISLLLQIPIWIPRLEKKKGERSKSRDPSIRPSIPFILKSLTLFSSTTLITYQPFLGGWKNNQWTPQNHHPLLREEENKQANKRKLHISHLHIYLILISSICTMYMQDDCSSVGAYRKTLVRYLQM